MSVTLLSFEGMLSPAATPHHPGEKEQVCRHTAEHQPAGGPGEKAFWGPHSYQPGGRAGSGLPLACQITALEEIRQWPSFIRAIRVPGPCTSGSHPPSPCSTPTEHSPESTQDSGAEGRESLSQVGPSEDSGQRKDCCVSHWTGPLGS